MITFERTTIPITYERISFECPKPRRTTCWTSVSKLLETRRPLRNKSGQFSVLVTNIDLAYELLYKSAEKGLTIPLDGTANLRKKDISRFINLKCGDFLTFAASPTYDVAIVTSIRKIKEEKITPVYDIEDDWSLIKGAVKEMATEKDTLSKAASQPKQPLYVHLKGTVKLVQEKKEKNQVLISDNWIRVGNYLIPKCKNDRVVFNFS